MVEPLIDEFEAQYRLIDNDGPVFWFHTDSDAPRGRVIAVDTRNPDRATQSGAPRYSVGGKEDEFLS